MTTELQAQPSPSLVAVATAAIHGMYPSAKVSVITSQRQLPKDTHTSCALYAEGHRVLSIYPPQATTEPHEFCILAHPKAPLAETLRDELHFDGGACSFIPTQVDPSEFARLVACAIRAELLYGCLKAAFPQNFVIRAEGGWPASATKDDTTQQRHFLLFRNSILVETFVEGSCTSEEFLTKEIGAEAAKAQIARPFMVRRFPEDMRILTRQDLDEPRELTKAEQEDLLPYVGEHFATIPEVIVAIRGLCGS